MEKQKSIYLREFCKRPQVTLKDFVSALKKDEERIRHRYLEKSELCSNEYANMILMDAVFIIELFIRSLGVEKHPDDYMLKKLWLKNGIQQDLLLLENKLPYFVLEALFKSTFPDNYQPTPESIDKRLTFHDLTCKYFEKYIPKDTSMPDQMKILHFTDLIRYFMSDKHPNLVESSSIKNLRSATKLHEAGIKFTKSEKKCLTDVKFEKGMLISCKRGKLIMPQFEVYDTTERLIRNLMALEQCHYPSEAYICNYVVLMDYLINTAKDVDLLVEKGVIVNGLGSNEAVAEMFNKLCINIKESNFCYHEICEKLTKHYKKRRHRAIKTLRSVYFANIWRGTSTAAAVILLGLTLMQTIYSVLGFHVKESCD